MRIEIQEPKLTTYQKKILESKKRFTVTESTTKGGKTFSHLFWIFKESHNPKYPVGANHWWIAPIYSQTEIAFNRLVSKLQGNPYYKINQSKLTVINPLGQIIMFKSADNPDSLYGEDVYSAVFDEFTRAKENAWHAIRSTLTYTKGKCKLIGNYNGQLNWGRKLADKALKEDSEYEYFKVTAYDAAKEGIISYEEIEQAKIDLPEPVFNALYLAEGSDNNDQLVDIGSINSLFTNEYIRGTGNFGIICDVAGYGSDRFVIMVVDGCRAIDIDINSKDPQESLLMVKRYIKKYNVPEHRIVYDADGVGQLFKTHFPGSRGVINNSTKYAKNYQNKKTRLAYELADRINKNELYFAIPNFRYKNDLIEELQCLRRKDSDKDGKLKIIPKEEIKQIIGRSPDLLDTLTYWMLIINDLT